MIYGVLCLKKQEKLKEKEMVLGEGGYSKKVWLTKEEEYALFEALRKTKNKTIRECLIICTLGLVGKVVGKYKYGHPGLSYKDLLSRRKLKLFVKAL